MDRDDDRLKDEGVDDLLRRAFEPDARSVRQIAANALSGEERSTGGPTRRRPAWPLKALSAAAVLAIVAGVIGMTLWRTSPLPAPRGTISNQGDIIVITAPDRPTTLIGSRSTAPPAPRGTASIVLLGEPQ